MTESFGISADGKTIIGFGLNPSGDQEAWLLYNSAGWGSQAIPEPSTVMLLGIGGLTLYGYRRRQRNAKP